MTSRKHNPDEHQLDTDSKVWELAGITLFRALGYVVGLPSFIVGTALFMLGFSVNDAEILYAACALYSLAVVAIGGRSVLTRLNPQNEKQALMIAAGSICVGGLLYIAFIALISIWVPL